jgi:hypothetical protein
MGSGGNGLRARSPHQRVGAERPQNSRFNAALIFSLLVDRSFHYLAAPMPPSMGVRLRCRQALRAIKPATSRHAQNPLRGTHTFKRWQFSSVHRTSCHAYLIRARDPSGLLIRRWSVRATHSPPEFSSSINRLVHRKRWAFCFLGILIALLTHSGVLVDSGSHL